MSIYALEITSTSAGFVLDPALEYFLLDRIFMTVHWLHAYL